MFHGSLATGEAGQIESGVVLLAVDIHSRKKIARNTSECVKVKHPLAARFTNQIRESYAQEVALAWDETKVP